MKSQEEIAKALSSDDEELRLQGVRALRDISPEDDLDMIFRAFGDSSWRVRKEAIDTYMQMPISRELIGEVIELLHADENAGLRNAAVEILTRIGRDAVPILLDQSGCTDHDVRKFIIDILGNIADQRAVPVMIKRLADEDSNVRAAAAENLGKLKADESVSALLEAMNSPDLLLQFTILDALSRIGAPLEFSKLAPYKDEKLLRKALVDCLGKVGDASSIPELVASLNDSMRNVREASVLALANIAKRCPDATRQELRRDELGPLASVIVDCLEEGGDPDLQKAAISILGWMGAGNAVITLLNLIDLEALQRECLMALVEIGVVQPQALLTAWPEVDLSRRAYLAYIIGEAQSHDGLPLLKEAVASREVELQRMAAYALGRLRSIDALPVLVDCLLHGEPPVQEAAIKALVEIGVAFSQQTFDALMPLISSELAAQRKCAVRVIGTLHVDSVIDALSMALKDPDSEVRRTAVLSFEGRDFSDMISSLLLVLTDEDPEVRRSAVDILSTSGSEEAFDGLQLALRDEDIWVRSSAVRGLGRFDAERSRPLIEAAIEDSVGLVSIAALETLVALIGDSAYEALIVALDHSDEEVVSAALNMLIASGSQKWFIDHASRLIDHPYWAARSHVARYAVDVFGQDARDLLEKRLTIETEDLVRQQLQDLLQELKAP